MTSLPSLDVVITAHKEGDLLLPTFISAQKSIKCLKEAFNVQVSILIFLDNPDEITQQVARELSKKYDLFLVEGSNGDPGLSRNQAISICRSDMIALLDGDDLWSENWLFSVYKDIQTSLENGHSIDDLIYHPEYNLIFGGHNAFVSSGKY
ncbi:glycosyltransferase [Vibrio sp. CDRSL-10 TSBA]